VDAGSVVYVADTFNDRIQKFSSDGTFLSKWDAPGSRRRGGRRKRRCLRGRLVRFHAVHERRELCPPEELSASGIAADVSGNVYVARYSSIVKYTSTGDRVTSGRLGSADGQFINAGGPAVDGSGNVYVPEAGNARVQKLICP
jgi:DNA-binding beta-propeller fold protein YncE